MAIQFTNGTATLIKDDPATKERKFNLPSAYYDDEPKQQAFDIAALVAEMDRKYNNYEPDASNCRPRLTDWGIYFKEKYGPENREQAAKAITAFWEDGDITELVVPGSCHLGGFIHGHDQYPNGTEVFTSNVQRLVRVEKGRKCGIPHDLCYAETASGSKYYFFTDEHNDSMFLFFGDVIHFGGLEAQREYYVPPRHRGKGYL